MESYADLSASKMTLKTDIVVIRVTEAPHALTFVVDEEVKENKETEPSKSEEE